MTHQVPKHCFLLSNAKSIHSVMPKMPEKHSQPQIRHKKTPN